MKAKKSLGQNFLKSEPALKKIIESGEVSSTDVVIEIGPGKGALTKKLLEKAGKVIAIEKDRELVDLLKEKFVKETKSGQLVLLEQDILELKINETVLAFSSGDDAEQDIPRKRAKLLNNKLCSYKLIANIPYNITGAILKKFLTDLHQPEKMVLMVQHEVARRIVAGDKKESILSISVKAYGTPKLVMKVPARYFSPAPKVDSAVINISNISRGNFIKHKVNEENFWDIVKSGFAHKRKKLSGNLKGVKNLNQELFLSLKDKRAEDLTLEDWFNLAKNS